MTKPCNCDDFQNPARISSVGGMIVGAVKQNPAQASHGMIVGGGVPVFNSEDGAIGSHPSKANFLSQLQRSMEDGGFAPAGIYGFARGQIPDWYRKELLPTPDAPAGFPEDRAAAWDDYLDGVNMGTYRGGLLGFALGAATLLAGLYFGGAMKASPKPGPAKASSSPALAAAHSAHRTHRSSSSRRKGR